MTKYEIVNLLFRQYGLKSYLEICTPTIGLTYAMIDANQLVDRQRLVYNCPRKFNDGLECAFRTTAPSSHQLVLDILRNRRGAYDIVFVDPLHTYRATMTDLLGAFCLVRPGGVIVVNDCCPRDAGLVRPTFKKGAWCGVTYQAFIDFAMPRQHLRFYTVDCDV